MSGTKEARRLDIGEDLAFQKRDWIAQRIGWAAIALIVIAALLGLFGQGPLSSVKVGDARGLRIDYERFVRHGARTQLQVKIDRSALTSGHARLSISRKYLLSLSLQQITPAPARVGTGGDALIYVFESLSPDTPMDVTFELQPEQLGPHDAIIALNDGPPVAIRQFTYP